MLSERTNCLVTGGAGFIGSHVVEHLTRAGHAVRVVDNLSTGFRHNLAAFEDVDFLEGDLQDPDVSDAAVRDIDVVFHLAALGSVPRSLSDAWGSHDANVNATLRLLESARNARVRRVVYSSSSSVYGDTPVLPKVESVEPLPRSPYAVTKLSGEQYVLAYARAGLVEGVALRYFNVFGPRQSPNGPYAAVIPLFLAAALEGTTARIHGDGLQTRDFTYVENVVNANLLGAFGPAERVSGTVVNCGAGGRTSLLELAQLIGEVSGRPIALEHGPARAGDVRDSLAGLERARAVLGYEPTVSLRDGLQRTWEWFAGAMSATARPAASMS
ncbi:NAD-dependent epimerase/dehydratase family protein [Roseisolibacter agri]|uniref:UDP-glucose 4-epimerase-like protein n=1 Tax=Roseisolibacter agri TaxID=2014610 RepID=A0AA37QKZ2_9BACT|nr:NAD-dependent epimerase/dehydratase family protein [Roseisolibacter agri]GLC28485.1 UDP-glucose 4-epimerase-like protein [Roseisolibacter agri]